MAKADSSAALRNDNKKERLRGQGQKQKQVLRLAALAQDDNFYFVCFI
jgi:fructose-1,6-bisphosphatase/sedoheptulose 1,7-bisphosphatase-like protein